MTVNKIFALIASVTVGAAVITGLLITGSPAEQRYYRLDEQRVRDLQALARSIEWWWRNSARMPADLQELVDGQRLTSVPVDPEISSPYVYERLADSGFRLCARFSRPSRRSEPGYFWAHEDGYQCFTFALNYQDQT